MFLRELLLVLTSGSTIVPLFYDARPLEQQTWSKIKGWYIEALRSLENKLRYNCHTIGKWRNSLLDVSGINGFVFGQLTRFIILDNKFRKSRKIHLQNAGMRKSIGLQKGQ